MEDYLRSDLACESTSAGVPSDESDVSVRRSHREGIPTVITEVKTAVGETRIGRPIGTYVTAVCGKLWLLTGRDAARCVRVLASLIRETALGIVQPEDRELRCLVVGLGNRFVTADALGPATVDRLRIGRTENASLYAFSPGVVGQTGIETAELIRGVCDRVLPDIVLAIDAYAARDPERLAATVQLSDTGILPGSGIGNPRMGVSFSTVGVPVLALGVPTVIDSSVLIYDALVRAGIRDPGPELSSLLQNATHYFVSLKETDEVVSKTSEILARAVEKAFSGKPIDRRAKI